MQEQQETLASEVGRQPEATASATVRVSVEGFEWLFTLRSFGTETKAPAELMPRMKWVNEQFIKMGAKPIFGKNGPATAAAQPAAQQAPAPSGTPKPKEILCPEHQVIATLKTGKDGAQWYSHKLADDAWCNVKEPK